MSDSIVLTAIEKYEKDRSRLLDMLLYIQEKEDYISHENVTHMADELGMSVADVVQTISFYHFLSMKPRGKYTVYLNNSVVANMKGRKEIEQAFEKEGNVRSGEVSEDGMIGLFETSCIGMNDQEPAAIINGVVFPNLTTFRVREILKDMRKETPAQEMNYTSFGDGKNAHPLMHTTVRNNIFRTGPLLAPSYHEGNVLDQKLSKMQPQDVLDEVKKAELRGRGGAGFPTGLKWEFCRRAEGDTKYIFCNADEGEPGTFKDRVLLTEFPEMVLEGMITAGYAVGAQHGIIYLRWEYMYMKEYLEDVIRKYEERGYLGKNVLGLEGFDFDLRIQFGAGAYVCGEESALIESAEGKRGEPRPRPPFPVEKGYLQKPTIVNNVETLCSVVNILQHGADWYLSLGTQASKGTKILSVSGDCRFPGIYEMEWGFRVSDILEMVGAKNTQAVQMGGPSGTLIGPDKFDHVVCYSDLATGGSLMIFDERRDLIKDVVMNFTDFFIDESCGSCVPCRNIPTLLRGKLEKIMHGNGTHEDLEHMKSWGNIMQINRCGLGHTAANPVLTAMENFPDLFESRIQHSKSFDTEVDLAKAIEESCAFVNREPVIK